METAGGMTSKSITETSLNSEQTVIEIEARSYRSRLGVGLTGSRIGYCLKPPPVLVLGIQLCRRQTHADEGVCFGAADQARKCGRGVYLR